MGADSMDMRPSRRWRGIVAGVLALVFLVADQLTKAVVRATFGSGTIGVTVIPGVIGFEYVENRGVAFGLAQGFGWIFVLLAVAVVVFVIAYLRRAPLISRWEVVGLGMVAGGAIGNAIDRAVFGFVTDFIATQFIDFPVFNVADIGITVGVVIAFIGFLLLSPANAAAKERAEEDRARRLHRADSTDALADDARDDGHGKGDA